MARRNWGAKVVSSPRGRTRMVAHKTVHELSEELLLIDDDLERLRREAALPLSVALTAAEEQEAIIAWPEARREKLRRRLTGA